MTTGKTITLTKWTFVGKVMSLLFNMLSRLVIMFLPRSKCLLISWLQSPSSVILEPPQNKVWHCFHCFRLVKAIVFPVVMYGCESWTIKKAKHQRVDAFELWYWRRLWKSLGWQGDPTCPSYRRSVLSVHWEDWCWICNSNTLATWCKELTHWKRLWYWERLRAREGGGRGWDG